MTIQTLFDRMMLHDNQLDLISGGDDVSRGLTAVNLVQDWWEMVAAEFPNLCQTAQSITTTAGVAYTAWPTALRRIDALYTLDADGRQMCELDPIDIVGGHDPALAGPVGLLYRLHAGSGEPDAYESQGEGGNIYWSPTPDAVYSIRVYGLWARNDYTLASDTFGYPDTVALAVAPFAVRLMRTGLDRDLAAVQGLAETAFKRAAASLRGGAQTSSGRVYSEYHDT